MKGTRTVSLVVSAAAAAALLAAPAARAEAPALIPLQGVLTESDGTPVDGTTAMIFALYAVETGGTALWTETQGVGVGNGFFTAYLGDQAAITRCDYRGPTITVISALGKLFGGYVAGSWSGSKNAYMSGESAFLFSLTAMARYPLGHYPENAMYTNGIYGPTFGAGHDIYIDSTINLGYCNFPYSYSYNGTGAAPNSTASNELCGRYTGGGSSAINELEVWYYQ